MFNVTLFRRVGGKKREGRGGRKEERKWGAGQREGRRERGRQGENRREGITQRSNVW